MVWQSLRQKSLRVYPKDLLLLIPSSVYIVALIAQHFQSNIFLATLPIALFLGFFAYIVVLGNSATFQITRIANTTCIAFGAVCIFYIFFPNPQILLMERITISSESIFYSPFIIHGYAGFGQPNNLASFAAAVGLLSYFVFTTSPYPRRLCGFMMLSLCAFVVFDTGSKVGALGLITGVITTVIFSSKTSGRHRILFLLLPLAIGAIASSFDFRAKTLDAESNRSIADRSMQLSDSSFQTRLDFLEISHDLWKLRPIVGHGLDSFARGYHQAATALDLDEILNASHPHNVIADLAVELGIVGVLFILGALSLWMILQLKSRTSCFLAIPAIPILLHTMTEFPQEASLNHWALFGLIMIFSRRHGPIQSEQAAVPLAPNLLRSFTGFISLLCFGLCVYISTALYLVTKQNLYYDQIHPIKVVVQDAMSPYGRLPFVSHKTDRLVAEQALKIAIAQENTNLAKTFSERYSNVLNYWGYSDGFDLESRVGRLTGVNEVQTD